MVWTSQAQLHYTGLPAVAMLVCYSATCNYVCISVKKIAPCYGKKLSVILSLCYIGTTCTASGKFQITMINFQ